MGVTRKIMIDGKEVAFRASAATPRLYRQKFQRDIIRDFADLRSKYKKISEARTSATEAVTPEDQFSIVDLVVFENLAYIMAWQADRSISESVDDWLDQFDTFSVYEILPELLSIWAQNNKTLEKPKNA